MEHGEGEGTRARGEGDNAGGEDRRLLLSRARVHVDHPSALVGFDPEEELAQPIDDLVAAVDDLQLSGEVGRPVGQVLDVGEICEHLVGGSRQDDSHGSVVHSCITFLSVDSSV